MEVLEGLEIDSILFTGLNDILAIARLSAAFIYPVNHHLRTDKGQLHPPAQTLPSTFTISSAVSLRTFVRKDLGCFMIRAFGGGR